MEERRFNRRVSWLGRTYINGRGMGRHGTTEHAGYIKCKLVHGKGYSVIVPDQLYVRDTSGGISWIQPLSFLANMILFAKKDSVCQIPIDISCQQTVIARFKNTDFIRRFDDGSEFFACTLVGPEDLPTYATGMALLPADNEPRLTLFHFTTEETKAKIEASGHYRPSTWNIQGNKKLKNVGYAYFTCLDSITCDADLHQIAMASNGTIHLVTDHIDPPARPTPAWVAANADNVLPLKVYRENTTNRRARLDVRIPVSLLASQHVHKHRPLSGAVYYNVCMPFIYRVGVTSDGNLPFTAGEVDVTTQVKRFDYIVLGSATTLNGLAAPYDEEDTKEKMLIERLTKGSLLDFWFANANKNLVKGKQVQLQKFQ